MRGISASGFLRVLGELGLSDSFDSLHGSSAGACAAAYFMAHQAGQGVGIYEDIGKRDVVSPYRIFSRPCMVDTDYIVEEIIGRKRPLNLDAIIAEPGVLNIVTTSVVDGQPVVHNAFNTGGQLLHALKATLRVPGPFENGIDINGVRHVDGGIAAPLPLFSAIEAGATHIVAVCTQRLGDYRANDKWSLLEALFLRFLYGRRLQQSYINSQGLRRLTAIAECRELAEVDVLVRPSGTTYCSWFTIDRRTLGNVEDESARAAWAYIHKLETHNDRPLLDTEGKG